MQPGSNKITTSFRVFNRGRENLVLSEVLTTCGCTVASISPKVVPPGQAAVVKVEGRPLGAGEKKVEVRIATNIPDNPYVLFSLTMVGSTPVPYVAASSRTLNFGTVGPDLTSDGFWIETRERKSTPPWILDAISSLKFMKIHGGLTDEGELGNGILYRRYEYTASLAEIPKVGGAFEGEVIIRDRSQQRIPVFSLPVHGRVRPAVSVTPSAIYANYRPGTDVPRPSIVISSHRDDIDLRVKVKSQSPLLVVRCKSQEDQRVIFEVSPTRGSRDLIDTTLIFSTNHSEAPEVRLPVSFRPILK